MGRSHPKKRADEIRAVSERPGYRVDVGPKPTEPVQRLLEIADDWQKFKGLPGAEGTLKAQPEKVDKQARFQAALAAAGEEPTTEATTPKKKGERRAKGEAEASSEAPAES